MTPYQPFRGRAAPPATGPDEKTVAYYDERADVYAESSWKQDLSFLLSPFCNRLPPGCRVLDLGSGAGRDSEALRRRGFDAVSLDASTGLLAAHKARGGRLLLRGDFLRLPFRDACFGGVWACASLLHVPAAQAHDVLCDIYRVMSPRGILGLSLKIGSGENRDEEGRRWTFYLPETARAALERASFTILEETRNLDTSGRSIEWLSLLASPARCRS
ncbi:MAG TPA: methyltransferase domain-containing protein [Candidatus Ozemobacteraceae bacterium]|nr:methyltransferase domain-containing protein [Candidatus Ozemobacteraceae bacterium]